MTENVLGTLSDRLYTPGNEPGAVRVATISSEQIKAARGLLRWEQTALAEASGLAVVTIKSIERRPGPLMVRTSSLYALVAAFDQAGVEFFDGDNGGAGVRFKHR
jgi:transcriptional regulator with XRE-family HTH domain